MSDDWKSFLNEVREQNVKNMEWSKQREQQEYENCCDGDACDFSFDK